MRELKWLILLYLRYQTKFSYLLTEYPDYWTIWWEEYQFLPLLSPLISLQMIRIKTIHYMANEIIHYLKKKSIKRKFRNQK